MEEPLQDNSKIKKNSQTTYIETFIHVLKGNIGGACFALANAFKHSGIIFGPIVTISLAIVCIYQQHVLINCSNKLKKDFNIDKCLDYAETLELSLLANKKWKKYARIMRTLCNAFLIITQIGFCSVYFLFIGNNLKSILDFYGHVFELKSLMLFALFPVLCTSMITNLKLLIPFSFIGNICMSSCIAITFYYTTQDLPPISERKYFFSSLHELPLFLGTVIYLYEGIAMVLPFKNSMKHPHLFSNKFGVLNVGMTVLTILFLSFGCIGYWKYGENVKSSLSLNLPIENERLARSVMIMIPIGVIMGFSLQLFIAIQVMYPHLKESVTFCKNHPLFGEITFRIFMVFVTFYVAILVPNLELLISMIGAVCSTSLAFVFPVFMDISLKTIDQTLTTRDVFRNSSILLLALIGVLSGGYESINGIIKLYQFK